MRLKILYFSSLTRVKKTQSPDIYNQRILISQVLDLYLSLVPLASLHNGLGPTCIELEE